MTVRNGKGKYVVSTQPYKSYLELRVVGIAEGSLGGPGQQTAVLLLCLPYPTNFFVTEIQLFAPSGQLLAPALRAPSLIPNSYPPYFDGHPFTIGNGELVTGAGYYTSCHACGIVQYLLTWKWTGSQLKLQAARKTSDQPPPPL